MSKVCKEEKYDERQALARQKGWRFAHISLLIYMGASALVYALKIIWCGPFVWFVLGMMLSFTVFIVYCIYKDAYYRLKWQGQGSIWIILLGAAFVLPRFISLCIKGFDLFVDYSDMKMLVGLSFVIIGVNLLIKRDFDRRETDQ